jgi:beta-glucosidase
MTSVIESAQPPYRDPSLPVDERVDDLLARMTDEEKAAQLGSAWMFELATDGAFSPDKAHELLRDGLGQVTRVSGASDLGAADAAAFANAVQRHLVEETRLGIPAIVHEEICSGLMARETTIFPQAIGLASTWEPELAEELAASVRRRMRAIGAHQGLSPVLDISRDPRWGRTEETFGEDPHLVSRMGVAFVRGLQGDDLREGVIATAKHFVGYGASEAGMNWAPARLGQRELREVYLHPFEAAVREAGLQSVMNAYNEIDGVPCTADGELLTSTLRELWGFDGCVVSDYFSIRQLADYHHLVPDGAAAAAAALDAGLDVELPNTDCYGTPLLDALRAGLVSEAAFHAAVRRVLCAKFRLGLFERPYADGPRDDVDEDRRLARRIAAKSIVLLRNDGTLPLAREQTVALIGPNAHDARNLLGDYTYTAHIESLAEMRESGRNVFAMPRGDAVEVPTISFPTLFDELGERLTVRHARGCDVTGDDRSGFDEAVALASSSDVAVLVLGDKAGLTDDCTSGESRDRASLDLPGVQEELAAAVLATGTPTLLVLVAGRPCGSAALHERCNAVLQAWLPGETGAAAIADVLDGSVDPGGKLPITFPRHVGQVPTYYGHKLSGGRSHWKGDYVDLPAAPLYPFGHGLAYTTFELAPTIREATVPFAGSIVVDVDVANTGRRDGEEVVQLYVRDPHASLTRPVLELKSFKRVAVAAGGRRRVTFEVPATQLGFYDRSLRYVLEPGAIDVFVGTSSEALVEAGTVKLAGERTEVEKSFAGPVVVA